MSLRWVLGSKSVKADSVIKQEGGRGRRGVMGGESSIEKEECRQTCSVPMRMLGVPK